MAVPKQPAHHRFATAVRRRMWVTRALDLAGTSTAWFAVAASASLACDHLAAIGPLVALAIAITAFRIFHRPPTLVAAAALTDAHLDWPDLLSTAIAATAVADPFAAAVRATADARCETVRLSAIPVPHRGRQGWAVIGTTVLAAIALPLAISRPGSITTRSPDQATAAALTTDLDASPAPVQTTAAVSPAPRRTGQDAMNGRTGSPSTEKPPAPGNGSNEPPPADHHSVATAGRGAASSQRETVVDPATATSASDRNGTGTTLAGGGTSTHSPIAGSDTSTSTTGAPAPSPTVVPPWQSPDWPAARRAADAAVAAGTIPPRDRDLVRAYFDRAVEKP